MLGASGEVVLPRRVVPQPTPFVVTLGDCGACVLGGALGISIERVYDELKGKRETIERGEMQRLLRVASSRGLAGRLIEHSAEWPDGGFHPMRPWGRAAHYEHLAWFSYVRMAIDAGYYGIAQVDFQRNGGQPHGGPNHWVMICGARHTAPGNGEKYTGHVLVSCSARSTGGVDEWVEAREFLQHRGGYNLLFVRPA